MPTKLTTHLFFGLLIIIGGLLSMTSCKTKEQECYQSVLMLNRNNFSIRYMDTVSNYSDSTNITVDSVLRFRDSFLQSPTMTVIDPDTSYPSFITYNSSQFNIPLDPAKDSLKFRFRTDTSSSIYDTITYFYTPQTHFINNGCGYTFYYNLDNVKLNTTKMLDSVSIIKSLVSDNATTNVIFYFKRRN